MDTLTNPLQLFAEEPAAEPQPEPTEAQPEQQQPQPDPEQARITAHLADLHRQGEAMRQQFPDFDLLRELRNPAFARMTAPQIGISVEDAYYAIHRRELQAAAAQQMANAIRAGAARPVENGASSQAASQTTFDYAHASKQQREALKRRIREAAAQGRKLYPGQVF